MSVYKRGGVYWYEFTSGGTRIRQSAKTTNKVSAIRAEAQARNQTWNGGPKILRRVDFETAMNEFLKWTGSQNKPGTHKRYRVSSKPLIGFFGHRNLSDMQRADIERFKLERLQECTNAGANRDLACVRVMLNWAVGQGYINASPFKGVHLLPEGPGTMRIVSHQQERLYLSVAPKTLRDVATVILETGMRPEEVFTIEPKNVHLEGRYVFVPKGKTCFARRNIPLTERATEVLSKRMAGVWCFPSRLDKAKHLTNVQKLHERTCKAIGGQFRLYDFRHTYGSRMAMSGVDLATLKELMGHSSITITMRYVHPTPEHKMAAVQKLETYNLEHAFENGAYRA